MKSNLSRDRIQSHAPLLQGLLLGAAIITTHASATPPRLEWQSDPYLPPVHHRTDQPRGAGRSVVQAGPYFSIQVNTDAAGNNILNDAANEPSIAISPVDPNRIVIGWRQFDNVASNFRQAGHAYSTDGGQSWINQTVFTPGTFRSDPVLEADTKGNFYYNSLRSSFLCDMFISPDGATWSDPIPATGGDKLWMIIDHTTGIGRNNIYCAWSTAAGCCGQNIFTRSTDGGQTYMNPLPLPWSPVWGTLAVGNTGILYISGVNFSTGNFIFVRSANAQDPLQTPTFSGAIPVDMGGALSWSTGPNPGGLLGQTWMATSPNTLGHDNLYLFGSVNPPGDDPLDVMFVRSVDGGASFSAPVRVNSDPPSPNSWQWFGTMSVAPNGRIDVIFNDTRASQAANISQLYYAYSHSAGAAGSWSHNIRISPTFNSHIGWPNQSKIGDYYHTRSDNASINIAYAATFNGEQDVYFLRVGDCNNNSQHDGIDITNQVSADVNGNGIPDECDHAACPADVTLDGTVNVNDVLGVINAWGLSCDGCAADVNGDGNVGLNDLIAVLNSWGECP